MDIKMKNKIITEHTNTSVLRQSSGCVKDNDKLVSFIYLLVRDKILFGELEEIMRQVQEIDDQKECVYTNGYLAKYSQDIAHRLRNGWKTKQS